MMENLFSSPSSSFFRVLSLHTHTHTHTMKETARSPLPLLCCASESICIPFPLRFMCNWKISFYPRGRKLVFFFFVFFYSVLGLPFTPPFSSNTSKPWRPCFIDIIRQRCILTCFWFVFQQDFTQFTGDCFAQCGGLLKTRSICWKGRSISFPPESLTTRLYQRFIVILLP